MSVQIDTAFVKQFQNIIQMLLAQKGSRLRECVMVETQDAEEQFWEQIGPVTAAEVTTRHGDSPLISTPHDRRRITLRFFDCGDLIDDNDRVRMLIDPTNAYAENAAAALGRAIDDVLVGGANAGDAGGTYGNPSSILDGTAGVLFGTAYTGKAGATTVTFPAGQVVALNFGGTNVGLTVPKLIEAKRLLMAANVDVEREELYIGCTSKGLADLLNSTQPTSAEFNEVRALVEGKITRFLGLNFRFLERLPQSATGAQHWRYPVWCKSGVRLSMARDIKTRIAERPDKRFSTYVYAALACGGTRMEEGKVVEIKGLI